MNQLDIWIFIEVFSGSFLGVMALRPLYRLVFPKREHNPLLADHIAKFSRK